MYCLILREFLTGYNDWNSLRRNYVFFYSRHGKQILQCQRELKAVFMGQLCGSGPGSRNPIYNGKTAIRKRWRSKCNREWLFFSTDEHLEVISTSLWGLREVTEENKRSKIHNIYLTTQHMVP